MYDVDLVWCVPGTGFTAFYLPLGESTVRVALGICMDLNPARDAPAWSFEDGPFELADYVLQQDARVLVLLNAWLASDPEAFDADDGPDYATIKYWVARLDPLWDTRRGDRIVLVANRCGTEDGVVFAGSSVVLQYSAAKNRVSIVKTLGRAEEAVLLASIVAKKVPLRIAIVQFDPKLGQPQRNLARVEQLVESIQPGSVDLLLLPEMALTGYVFRSPDAVLPFLEHPRDGLTTTLARALARRFDCAVITGYPQALADDEHVRR